MSNVRSITPNDPANFTPELGNYKVLQPFRYWCQKVLPLVYDDSLSYYELLCKVVDYLNKTMEDVTNMGTDMTNLYNAYNELQSYVNNYFSTLDVTEEINNKLDEMVSNGTFGKILIPLLGFTSPSHFGAVGDGITDDSDAFQKCFDSINEIVLSDNTMVHPVIAKIYSGKYLITKTITISNYVKLRCFGNAILYYTGSSALLNYIPLSTTNINENVQQDFESGGLIDGDTGLFLLNSNKNGTGIEITMPNDNTLKKTIARTTFNNIKIKNFNKGIHVSAMNFYMVTFNNITFQDNNVDFRIDAVNGSLPINSGERITFNSCLFTGAVGVTLNCTSLEFLFINCSFDFEITAINSLMSYNVLKFIGCHIEQCVNIIAGTVNTLYPCTVFENCNFVLDNSNHFANIGSITLRDCYFMFTDDTALSTSNIFLNTKSNIEVINTDIKGKLVYGKSNIPSSFFELDTPISNQPTPFNAISSRITDVALPSTISILNSGGFVNNLLEITCSSDGTKQTGVSIELPYKDIYSLNIMTSLCVSISIHINEHYNGKILSQSDITNNIINDGVHYMLENTQYISKNKCNNLTVNFTINWGPRSTGEKCYIYGILAV